MKNEKLPRRHIRSHLARCADTRNNNGINGVYQMNEKYDNDALSDVTNEYEGD